MNVFENGRLLRYPDQWDFAFWDHKVLSCNFTIIITYFFVNLAFFPLHNSESWDSRGRKKKIPEMTSNLRRTCWQSIPQNAWGLIGLQHAGSTRGTVANVTGHVCCVTCFSLFLDWLTFLSASLLQRVEQISPFKGISLQLWRRNNK